MQVSIKDDIKDITKYLTTLEKKLIPKVTTTALNWTGFDIQRDLYMEMKEVFKTPTPWVVPNNLGKATKRGSLFVDPAKGKKQSVKVWVKDRFPFNAMKFLGPHIYGGSRKPKASEEALRQKGLIGSTKFIVPAIKGMGMHGTKGIRLNKYGNVTSGAMTKMLSGLSALRGAAKGAKNRQKTKYFVRRLGGPGSETGLWERSSKTTVRKLFHVISSPKYRKRFFFHDVAHASNRRHFSKNFVKLMKNELRQLSS